MANDTILISATGQPGSPGTQFWDASTSYQAPQGTPGRHGRDATLPTSGGMGGDIHVNLGFNPSRPGFIQVQGAAHRAGSRWEVGGGQGLLLDVKGGDGGAGGLGEPGQAGGDGFHGRDATKISEATDGSPGMNGGDGGRGTSGAAGGQGGSANVTVSEEDLDTLLGLQWDIRGGKGGVPGQHGASGDGGSGGNGGDGYWWTESVPYQYRYADGGYSHTDYHTKFHSRPSGNGGPAGQPGRYNTEQLFAGHDGPPGFAQITVFSQDGRRTVYPARYMLEVVDFKVSDENGDGINEPGEYLYVSDIVIKNTGAMPSPKLSKLQVLIRGTKWLEPVPEPLELPVAILPGHSVQVPGKLRAFIKNETSPREPGTLLQAKDTVSLRAYSMRLQRDVPEFSGRIDITCQYPLLMTTPKYLDCVAKGDIVRFSWTIQNISKRSQGRAGSLRRETGTHLSDPKGMFDLKRAPKETPHDIMDMIEVLDPGETMPVTVDFQVSELVNEFTTGNMIVNLMLSDPHTKKMRNVVSFDLRIQISPSYRYNPAARFLLVINGSSPNAFVVQIINFIQEGLHLPVDVFNLSLTGSFQSGDTRQEVLTNYTGKTVILLGNTMNYFQQGKRDPWELLDVGQAFALAKDGTAFLVISPSNTQSLKGFAHLLAAGGVVHHDDGGGDPDVDHPGPDQVMSIKDLLAKLAPGGGPTSGPPSINLQVKKKALRKLAKTLTSTAKTTQQKLTNNFPLRRFLVAPSISVEVEPKAKQASLTVVEGLPHRSKFFASLLPLPASQALPVSSISEYTVALLTHSLPFRDQCSIFWKLAGRDTTFGVPTNTLYSDDLAASSYTLTSTTAGSPPVSGKALSSLTWSISTQLASELTHFHLSGSGYASRPLIGQLPLLHTFIASSPKSITPEIGATFSSLAQILGHIRGVVSPLSFSQKLGASLTSSGKRRKKVQKVVVSDISSPLLKVSASFAQPKSTPKKEGGLSKSIPPSEEVKTHETQTKKQLGDIRKRNPQQNCVARAHEVACILLQEVCRSEVPVRYWDVLNDPEATTKKEMVRVLTRDEYVTMLNKYEERRERVETDAEFSYVRLKGMVSKGGGQGQQSAGVEIGYFGSGTDLDLKGVGSSGQATQTDLTVTDPDDQIQFLESGGGGGGVSPLTTVSSPALLGGGVATKRVPSLPFKSVSPVTVQELPVAVQELPIRAQELPVTVSIR
ncbi:hypothetical protein QBC43DRAFT_315491 [Cladorrhinum sp. PSN259]|nr:hypothetical protein QBC43DRAFT_315491 [Cladorrhinum sp. PSN259]